MYTAAAYSLNTYPPASRFVTWDFKRFMEEIDFLGRLLSSRMDDIESSLDLSPLVRRLDEEAARRKLLEFFGPGVVQALGVDGSMSYEDRMEIVVLYIAVSGFRVPLEIAGNGELRARFEEMRREEKYTFSTVIPIWIEDLNEIVSAREVGVTRSLEAVMESVPFALMTFGEYYMGLRGLRGDVDVLILDRPLASSIHPYRRDARKLLFDEGGGRLAGLRVDGERVSAADIFLAVYAGPFVGGRPLFPMPYRGRFRIPAIVQFIVERGGYADVHEIRSRFGIGDAEWRRALRKLTALDASLGNELFVETAGPRLELRDERMAYWERVRALIDYVGRRLFSGSGGHPLYLGEGRWLSTRDVNTLTLLAIYEIARVEAERGKLVIGIGKDTYVTDLHRSVIPLSAHLGLVKRGVKVPIKSDRPLLTLASSLRPDVFRTPWRFAGYDGAFATLVENDEGPDDVPLKAARKVIYPEGLIVRSYFQLRSLRGAGGVEVKSPVFFYDRFQRPEDAAMRVEVKALEGRSEVTIRPYLEVVMSEIDNMILYMLSRMDNPEITEATGHNYLLFMADKDVKAAIAMVKEMVIGAADARINEVIRDRRVFVVTRRFRDFRRLVEARRRR